MTTLINSYSIASPIGIGTYNPNKALTVVGDISATGNIYSAGGNVGGGSLTGAITAVKSNNDDRITATTTNGAVTIDLPTTVKLQNLNVAGTFNVPGTANFYNTTNLNVSSNIIYFGEGNTGNVLDLALVAHLTGNLNNGTPRYQHTGLARQAGQNSPGIWTLFSGLTSEPGSNSSGITWTDPYLQVDTLSANVLGNLSGNYVTVGTGNSDQWNSVYSSVANTSGNWNTVYSSVANTSGNWNTVYSTYQNASGANGFVKNGGGIANVTSITQANYNQLSPPDPNTLYIISS
jgi:hypothetical protein